MQKKKPIKKWMDGLKALRSYNLAGFCNLHLFLSPALLVLFFFFANSNWIEPLDFNISKPLDFKSRQFLGKSPKIDSQFKVFNFDDEAIQYN